MIIVIYIYIHSLHSISMIQIISWNCVDILEVCVECVLPSSHHLTPKTCLCLSDADFLQQKCLLALEVEHPIGHYFLDCSAWPRSGLRTKDMAAWCNTLWSWCRLKKHCNICATSTLKRTRRSIWCWVKGASRASSNLNTYIYIQSVNFIVPGSTASKTHSLLGS